MPREGGRLGLPARGFRGGLDSLEELLFNVIGVVLSLYKTVFSECALVLWYHTKSGIWGKRGERHPGLERVRKAEGDGINIQDGGMK